MAAILAFTFTIIHVVGEATALLLVGFGGLILGAYLSGVARFIAGRAKASYRVGIAVTFGVHLVLLGLLVPWWMAEGQPQAEQLARDLPTAVALATDRMEATSWGAWLMDQVPPPARILRPQDGNVVLGLGRVVTSVGGAIAALVILLFIGIYFAVDPDTYRRGVLLIVPRERRRRASEVIDRVGHTMRRWVAGRIVSAAVIGAGTALGLWTLEIPLPLMLGLLAAVFTFVPNFGPLVSVVPPAMFALTDEPAKVLWVLVLFSGLQAIESYVLTPMIEKKAVALPPVVLLVTQIVLGLMAGIVGLALAAPLTALVMVLVRELYVRDVLGTDPDQDDVIPDDAPEPSAVGA